MAASEALKRAVRKYDAKMTRQFCLKFNLKTDEDVIKQLTSVPNMQGYIRELVRNDIERKREKE